MNVTVFFYSLTKAQWMDVCQTSRAGLINTQLEKWQQGSAAAGLFIQTGCLNEVMKQHSFSLLFLLLFVFPAEN